MCKGLCFASWVIVSLPIPAVPVFFIRCVVSGIGKGVRTARDKEDFTTEVRYICVWIVAEWHLEVLLF